MTLIFSLCSALLKFLLFGQKILLFFPTFCKKILLFLPLLPLDTLKWIKKNRKVLDETSICFCSDYVASRPVVEEPGSRVISIDASKVSGIILFSANWDFLNTFFPRLKVCFWVIGGGVKQCFSMFLVRMVMSEF